MNNRSVDWDGVLRYGNERYHEYVEALRKPTRRQRVAAVAEVVVAVKSASPRRIARLTEHEKYMLVFGILSDFVDTDAFAKDLAAVATPDLKVLARMKRTTEGRATT